MVVRQPCQPPHTVLPATWSTVTRHTKTEQWTIIITLAGVMSVNSNSRVWHTSGPLVILTLYPSSDGCFQQENTPHHKAQIISNWFSEHDSEFTVLKWPPLSSDLNPIEHLCTRKFATWACSWKMHSSCEMLSCHYELKPLRNVFSSLLTLCYEELQHFWK